MTGVITKITQRVICSFLAHLMVIFVADARPQQHRNPRQYAPGYSLFKVKRPKKPDYKADAPIEEIREKGEVSGSD